MQGWPLAGQLVVGEGPELVVRRRRLGGVLHKVRACLQRPRPQRPRRAKRLAGRSAVRRHPAAWPSLGTEEGATCPSATRSSYMPIRHSAKFGFFVDERGGMGGIDVRVKKTRGCQGSGSAARHRFLGTCVYFNEGLFSKVVVSIFKIVY